MPSDTMEAFAQSIVALAPLLLSCLWSLIRIVRGRQVFGSFFLCWVLLIVWHAFFIVALPLMLYSIDKDAGLTLTSWQPEAPYVIAIVFFGWFPAGVTVLLAIFVRDLSRYFSQKPNLSGGV